MTKNSERTSSVLSKEIWGLSSSLKARSSSLHFENNNLLAQPIVAACLCQVTVLKVEVSEHTHVTALLKITVQSKAQILGRKDWIVELNSHFFGVLCFGKVLLVCHSGLSPVTPPGSERLQENNRPSGSFQSGYISHLGQDCACAFYSWQDEKSWLNKDQLLFIHLLFWLMASESHSSGLKIDRWLPSLHCGLLKFTLWCDYSKYLAYAPEDKVDLWSYSSFDHRRS